jgi:hypothetical protein
MRTHRRRCAVGLLLVGLGAARPTAAQAPSACGTVDRGSAELLALHAYDQSAAVVSAAAAPDAAGRDVDDVALLEDRGDLVVRRNLFDLDDSSVRLTPNAAGGFDAAPLSLPVEAPGSPLGLGAGDGKSVDLPFAFPFFGAVYRSVFVNADGSLTFAAETAGTPGLAKFLAGPPRIAPFFADLDPSRGGSVTTQLVADRAVFSWNAVPGGSQINHNTFQATLHPNGAIDLVYGTMETREAVVGVSPGHAPGLTAADLTAGRPRGSSGALAERFSESEHLDLVSVARRFLAGHADAVEQLVIYTTRPLNPFPGTLAFEINVRNEVRGIGLDLFDDSAEYGSRSVLASLVYMDSVDQYLDVDGFEILGHEVAHRWLARLRFRDRDGRPNDALLGRQLVHWSFFMDTDASVMEGNETRDLGGGRFETVDFARGYSALDQYTMGLRLPSEVPPFFYVAGADDFRPNRAYKASSGPEAGVSFTGIRRDVRVEDVVAALGPREPDAAHAPRLLRQAFILVADSNAPATPARLQATARIRERFPAYYRQATDGRGDVQSTLP